MQRRHRGPGAQEAAPKRCPRAGDPRRSGARLPGRTAPGGGGSEWWQDRDPESPRPAPRLPGLLLGSPRGAPGRGALGALLLPPLLSAGAGAPRSPEARRPRAPAAAAGGLLEGLLPCKFRDFLRQLRAKCAELEPEAEPRPHTPPARQPLFSKSKHWQHPQCPNCSFLPDLHDQASYLPDSKETLFHQKPTLWSPRSEHSQFTPVKTASQFHSTQVPRVKTVLIQTPSREGSRPCRRYCPFRVRFADETLQDSALRYWERSRAVCQNGLQTQQTTLPTGSVSERVLGSVGKWLESLPRALHPEVKKAVGSSSCYDYPYRSAQEPNMRLSEGASGKSALLFIPRASTPRHQGGLKTFLDTCNPMQEPVDKWPSSWSQKLSSIQQWPKQPPHDSGETLPRLFGHYRTFSQDLYGPASLQTGTGQAVGTSPSSKKL
uniref:uncharacterized protein C9orf50 homolog n=1 Tax=Jaculus jaculus TaxID=51337 RepID=UPI001E1B31B8|nr:uncharacterized protein C9orf50 homolog [Jaculus jaculus]